VVRRTASPAVYDRLEDPWVRGLVDSGGIKKTVVFFSAKLDLGMVGRISVETGASAEPETLEQRRKRQILTAVIAVVAEAGFERATLRRIADRAGVSVGMLSYYYRDKRALIEAALSDGRVRSFDDVNESMHGDAGPHRIQALFEHMLERSRSGSFPLSFWLAYWAEAAHDEQFRQFSLGGLGRVRESFCRALEVGMASGELRDDLDVERGASLLMTLWQGARAEVGLAYADEGEMALVVQEALRLMKPAPPPRPQSSSLAGEQD
jgi:AcrR family transcriptional regulator